MEKLILGFMAIAIPLVVWAAPTPFGPKVEERFLELENAQVMKFVYDVAIDGGDVAAHGLGKRLPANAIITRSFFYVDTQFVDGGTGTVALSCEDANNIKTATDITGNSAGALVEGESTGAASAFKSSIAASCEITATVATAEQTAGKLTGWVYYVIHN
jgi:hypothetical protein